MKKKFTQDGQPYYFTTDTGVDKLSLSIINKLKKVDETPNMTMRDKLWEAAYHHIKENINEKNVMMFNRPTHITTNETEYDICIYWITKAIDLILKSIKNNENTESYNFIDEKNNNNGLTRFKTSGGNYLLKGILSPQSIFLTKPDYLKLDEMVRGRLGVGINELNSQQFYRLQTDLINNNSIQNELPSFKIYTLLPNNKNVEIETEQELFTQLTRNEEIKIPNNKLTKAIINVFEDIN